MQKLPFNKDGIQEIFDKVSDLKVLFKNDIYFNQTAHIPAELNRKLIFIPFIFNFKPYKNNLYVCYQHIIMQKNLMSECVITEEVLNSFALNL